MECIETTPFRRFCRRPEVQRQLFYSDARSNLAMRTSSDPFDDTLLTYYPINLTADMI